jgi:hypothetical protein
MEASTQTVAGQPNNQLASLAKSFATLETLKLRIRMKPAPKAVDVSKDAKPSRRSRHEGILLAD